MLGALVLALALATTAAAATAYYSFTGAFTNGTEIQSFLFNIRPRRFARERLFVADVALRRRH